jgi:hypothetical protein
MAKYLITYQGGGEMDPSQMDKVKEAFGAWLAKAGSAVTDPGSPTMPVAHVANGTAVEAAVGGYTLMEASSKDEVVELLKSHPFVARGGTLQVNEVLGI